MIKELQFFGLAVLRGMLVLVILYDMLRIVRRVIAPWRLGVWLLKDLLLLDGSGSSGISADLPGE